MNLFLRLAFIRCFSCKWDRNAQYTRLIPWRREQQMQRGRKTLFYEKQDLHFHWILSKRIDKVKKHTLDEAPNKRQRMIWSSWKFNDKYWILIWRSKRKNWYSLELWYHLVVILHACDACTNARLGTLWTEEESDQ